MSACGIELLELSLCSERLSVQRALVHALHDDARREQDDRRLLRSAVLSGSSDGASRTVAVRSRMARTCGGFQYPLGSGAAAACAAHASAPDSIQTT